MRSVIRGRVIKLGDKINTDVIAPGRWKSMGMDVLRRHTMEAVRPDFYSQVRPGDILVAGCDFGCGSHREQATEVMKAMGISAVAADSVARLYFRSGIAFGLPIIAAEKISEFAEEGDDLEIVMEDTGIHLINHSQDTELDAPALPEIMRQVLEAGGIYQYLKAHMENG